MNLQSILSQIALDEESTRQFKENVKNDDSLTPEMAAFVNTGGMVLSGHFDPISDLLSMEPAV